MESLPKLYTLTKYPNIFKGSYWGVHRNDRNDDEVIENRNKFVEEFGIKRRVDKVPEYIERIVGYYELYCDEKPSRLYYNYEVYYTANKQYIIVMSPYFIPDWSEMKQFYEGMGYSVYPHLYSKSTATFIKIIKKGCRK